MKINAKGLFTGIPQQDFLTREALVQSQCKLMAGTNSCGILIPVLGKIQLFMADRHTPIVTPECFYRGASHALSNYPLAFGLSTAG